MHAHASPSGNSWLSRAAFCLAGFVVVGFVPLLGRFAGEACEPSLFAFPCFGWSAAALASLAIGFGLMCLGYSYRRPWRRVQRWLHGDGVTVIVMVALTLGFGTVAYLMKDLVIDYCWKQFSWSCLLYGGLDFVFWLLTAVFALCFYFGVVHHPILRMIGGQRSMLSDDTDEYA